MFVILEKQIIQIRIAELTIIKDLNILKDDGFSLQTGFIAIIVCPFVFKKVQETFL